MLKDDLSDFLEAFEQAAAKTEQTSVDQAGVERLNIVSFSAGDSEHLSPADFLSYYFGRLKIGSENYVFSELHDKVSRFVWHVGAYFLELVNRPIIGKQELAALEKLEKLNLHEEVAKQKIEHGYRRVLIDRVQDETSITLDTCLTHIGVIKSTTPD